MPDTIYTGINLMLPTMGRAKTRLPDFVDSAEETCGDRNNVVYSFMLHRGDTETEKYIKKRLPEKRLSLHYESLKAPHLAKFWNRLYAETKFQDKGLMVSMVGDDMIFQSRWWDDLLLDECNKYRGLGVWFGDDCKNTHDALMVNIFTTRRTVDGQRPFPFMCEAFPCDDMDWVWDHVARRLGIRYYLSGFKLFHNHATFKDENMDDVWKRLRTVFPVVEEERKNMNKYVEERIAALRKNIPELTSGKLKPSVLFVCMGRYGDVIHASFHANRLIQMGFDIVWLTIKLYEPVIRCVCPDCKIRLYNEDDSVDWEMLSSSEIKAAFTGYDFFVNAQPGAEEHHGAYIRSKKSIVEFLDGIVCAAVPIKTDLNILKYAVIKNLPETLIPDRTDKPLCIIAPNSISAPTVWPHNGLEGIVRFYKDKYDVRILAKTQNEARPIDGAAWLYGYTFVECLSIISQCDLFIGQDSGLAWGAMFFKCKKIIYHDRKRLELTNTRFSDIDKSFQDIVLG